LRIRKSSIGPNAFALPGNLVVLTDELVTLVDGDPQTISGVLAHELGHLKHQHGLRSVVHGTALTILGSALIGDYSSALAAIPAALGHLNYSRHFEFEADAYSRDVLCDAHIDPAKTALFFEKAAATQGNVEELIPNYLRSHPVSENRAAYFRKPCPKP
jgi:predicted Zn-dependent protease